MFKQRNSFRSRTIASRQPSTSVLQSPEITFTTRSRRSHKRFPSFSIQAMPFTDSSEGNCSCLDSY
ncbi:hypothetical protein DSO57_1008616 [Entomophthora muscae]|uniref:Uncharacterized protein n=1 Tax=Entomophthora muscae TaxID=34485 RepID=A0ACC2RY55_9FUNG|nr:hypothetical protein DSO57_1008616 [Entomophthora muscae]